MDKTNLVMCKATLRLRRTKPRKSRGERRTSTAGIAQYLKQVECGNGQRTLAETSEFGEERETPGPPGPPGSQAFAKAAKGKTFDSSFDRLAKPRLSKKKKHEGIGKTKKNGKKNNRKSSSKRSTRKSTGDMNTCTVAKVCDPIVSVKLLQTANSRQLLTKRMKKLRGGVWRRHRRSMRRHRGLRKRTKPRRSRGGKGRKHIGISKTELKAECLMH